MKITMAHGSGGNATKELIANVFQDNFSNEILNRMEDSAVITLPSTKIAYTTDSYVVQPIFFNGGDIGKLAVCGTVNDLLMQGAVPKYLTCGFIIEEGFEIEDLKKIAHSMQLASKEANVIIVAGDTKVINGTGGIYINTSGIGIIETPLEINSYEVKEGDVVILSGILGEHHACILSHRMNIQNSIKSDCAHLTEMVNALLNSEIEVHTMRDVTRGGLATVLGEIAEVSQLSINLVEEDIPTDLELSNFCDILGLDPLYMGNEGKFIAIVPQNDAQKALDLLRKCANGQNAAIIGEITKSSSPKVLIKTRFGGSRILDILNGEGLPRIC